MLRTNPPDKITPQAINGLDAETNMELASFLRGNTRNIIPGYSLITFNSTPAKDNAGTTPHVKTSFSFTRSLLRRERKAEKKGIRYEVFYGTEPVTRGGTSEIFVSEGVLILNDNNVTFKSKYRILKKQDPKTAKDEYFVAKDLPRLRMKPPVMIYEDDDQQHKTPIKSYLVMRLFPGDNLFEITQQVKHHDIEMDTNQRLSLTLDVLSAIKEQVHQHNLVHRDLKAENIIVDLNTNEINIIDYEKAKKLLDPQHHPDTGGTLYTMPQEQFSLCDARIPKYSIRSDSYAIGKVIAELWRARPAANIAEKTFPRINNQIIRLGFFYKHATKDTDFNYDKFTIGDLSESHAGRFKVMLEHLTRAHPNDRWSIDQAIDTIKDIQRERQKTAPKLNM